MWSRNLVPAAFLEFGLFFPARANRTTHRSTSALPAHLLVTSPVLFRVTAVDESAGPPPAKRSKLAEENESLQDSDVADLLSKLRNNRPLFPDVVQRLKEVPGKSGQFLTYTVRYITKTIMFCTVFAVVLFFTYLFLCLFRFQCIDRPEWQPFLMLNQPLRTPFHATVDESLYVKFKDNYRGYGFGLGTAALAERKISTRADCFDALKVCFLSSRVGYRPFPEQFCCCRGLFFRLQTLAAGSFSALSTTKALFVAVHLANLIFGSV